MAKTSRPKIARITAGLYVAKTVGYVGIFQLEVKDSLNSVFSNIVSTHLPPVVLEKLSLKHTYTDLGVVKLSPAPLSIKPDLTIIAPDTLKVIQKQNDAEIYLIKQ